jgi:hypothetical protein
MSRVPLPERGQPLDLAYIYQIANAVNELASQLSPTIARYTTVKTPSGEQSARTSDIRIVATYVTAENSSATTADGEGKFTATFSDFKFVPVVTATPILTGNVGTEASKDIVVVLTKITTNLVEGIVKFNTIGVAEVDINLIAVGIAV